MSLSSQSPPDDGGHELSRLLALSRAFKASKALNLSAKLGLYTVLAQHPYGLTWAEMAGHLGWRRHAGF